MLTRSPVYLRVTEKAGAWDALDQLDDVPESGELVHVYWLVEKPGWMHLQRRRGGGGTFSVASYSLCPEQPLYSILRDTALWREWTDAQPRTFALGHPLPQEPS